MEAETPEFFRTWELSILPEDDFSIVIISMFTIEEVFEGKVHKFKEILMEKWMKISVKIYQKI